MRDTLLTTPEKDLALFKARTTTKRKKKKKKSVSGRFLGLACAKNHNKEMPLRLGTDNMGQRQMRKWWSLTPFLSAASQPARE